MKKKNEKQNDNVIEKYDVIDQLLDDENEDPIYLYDESGNKVAFEKDAIINLDGYLYFLLSPLDILDDIGQDEALVFKAIQTDDGDELLVVEDDEKVVEKVFDEYYRLLEDYDNE